MDAFKIGDTVTITAPIMQGSVGTVVHLDTDRERYLVRVGASAQNWYAEDELKIFDPTS